MLFLFLLIKIVIIIILYFIKNFKLFKYKNNKKVVKIN